MPELLPPPPANWSGSIPEWLIFWAFLQLGYEEGPDFTYQAPVFGGRAEYGGAVLDFVFPALGIAVNVQSVRYHYETGVDKMKDEFIRAAVEAWGTTLIFIDEEDARRSPVYYAKEALAGRDYSRMKGG